MHAEMDRKRIVEFLDLIGNEKYDLRKFGKPVLVYIVEDHTVRYSIWEASVLERFGLKNVDGWDYEEDDSFVPDWVIGSEAYFDDEDDDDDDED